MDHIQTISARARELIASESQELDLAINRAVDEAFEAGLRIDGEAINERVKASLVGLGVLDELVKDPTVEEIWLNAPDAVFIAQSGSSKKLDLSFTELQVRQAVERMLRDSGRRLDRSEPFVDATLADGSRLHVAIPDVTSNHWAINIRKFPKTLFTLADLVERSSLSSNMAEFLKAEFLLRTNILVSGATQAGKTTLLCALLDVGRDRDRLISVEETFEIRTNYQDHVALQARQANLEGVGEITLRRLVREALRMRPTRLVIGEVRQAEALDLLIALNSGIAGLCTIHANSAEEAIAKLKLLPLLAGENIPAQFVDETVERTIGLVVHCQMHANGERKIAQVLKATRTTAGSKWERVEL